MGKAIGLILEGAVWAAILLLIIVVFEEELERLADLLVMMFN